MNLISGWWEKGGGERGGIGDAASSFWAHGFCGVVLSGIKP